MTKTILMISAEASGDLHGSSLIKEIRKIDPSVKIKGMGGSKMLRAGLEGIDSSRLAVVGLAEAVEKLGDIWRAYRQLKELLYKEKFHCVVLIDYPEFNLKFAGLAKKRGVPVVYYISPQVWAWRRGRVKKIARVVDKMLVVFPFEEAIYREAGVDVEYVGHPLAEKARLNISKDEARKELALKKDSVVVSILAGSRTDEVKKLLAPMLEGIRLFEEKIGKDVAVLIPAADTIKDELIEEELRAARLKAQIVRGALYEALRASDLAVVTSGTATLETALIGTPMIIVYRVSPLSYFIGRFLVGVEHIGLPNIVAGEGVVPELIQKNVTPENIAEQMFRIFTDDKVRAHMIERFRDIRKTLSKDGSAPQRAAQIIYQIACRGD